MDSKPEKRVYPTQAADYTLLEEVGHGANALVYRAICKPYQTVVAIKQLDLEACNCNLDRVSEEAKLMSLIDHPNVVKAYCSFIVGHFLWVVMPYMEGGSCLHIMKVSYPGGLREAMIATVLKETLKALDYLHRHGHIHRDIKAGNILIDANGAVKLADFGVSAFMLNGVRQRSRNTFIGTPCWMAPEVMEQTQGYDFRADIWSFGITALELAHGHAPFSKFSPIKVLLMTLQSPPPRLDTERDKHFSKAFKEMLALCLVKNPNKRPTAEKLLKHSFFKQAKSNDWVTKKLLSGLNPLWERERMLREKDADPSAQKRPAYLEEEEKSQDEYKRSISGWNFDLESLKEQAASANSPRKLNKTQSLNLEPCYIGRGTWSSEKEPTQMGRFGVYNGALELQSPGWQEVVRQTKDTNEQPTGELLPTIVEDQVTKTGAKERT